jgi:hypothetical protein
MDVRDSLRRARRWVGSKQMVRWKEWMAVWLAPNMPVELQDLWLTSARLVMHQPGTLNWCQKIEAYLRTARTECLYRPESPASLHPRRGTLERQSVSLRIDAVSFAFPAQ